MQTLTDIKALLALHGLRPKKRLGQNFLHDQNHLRRLVDASALRPGDLVLEVGPGTGTLTEALLERGAEVVACEIDRDLAALLRQRLGGAITLVEGDCLRGTGALGSDVAAALRGRPFVLVSNLPFQVAGTIMAILLVSHPECRGQFVTIQKEVAGRLRAGPGSKDYGPLSVLAAVLGEVELLAELPPSCFWPQPEVRSAMCAVRRRADCAVDPVALSGFLRRLFRSRRKQVGSILGRDAALPEGVTAQQRPEEISPDLLVALWRLQPE